MKKIKTSGHWVPEKVMNVYVKGKIIIIFDFSKNYSDD